MQIGRNMVWKRWLETGMKIQNLFISSQLLYNQLPSQFIRVNQVALEWTRQGSIKKRWIWEQVIYSLLAIGKLSPTSTKRHKSQVLEVKAMRLQWQTITVKAHNLGINGLEYRVETYPLFSPNKVLNLVYFYSWNWKNSYMDQYIQTKKNDEVTVIYRVGHWFSTCDIHVESFRYWKLEV